MPYNEYSYTDTANDLVSASLLHEQIDAEGGWPQALEGVTRLPAQSKFRVHWGVSAMAAADLTALDAVVAAHSGVQLVAHNMLERATGADTEGAGTWKSRIQIDEAGFCGGWYLIEAHAMLKLTAAPDTAFVEYAEARLTKSVNGAGATQVGRDDAFTERSTSIYMRRFEYLSDGDSLTVGLDFRRNGAGFTASIEEASVRLRPAEPGEVNSV